MKDEFTAFSASSAQRSEPNTINEVLQEYLAVRHQFIDDGITAFLQHHYEGQILEVMKYVTEGGKRLRGILTILTCEALGSEASDALAAAVAVELAHAASLVHDDLIDGDVARRSRPALHVRYDVATAVLIPHLIIPHSILSALTYGPRAINTILEGWARVVRGQVRDYVFPKAGDRSGSAGNNFFTVDSQADTRESVEREYREIIGDKTAALFETAAILGAIAARDDSNADLAQEYARLLGSAFQIADDVTDLEAHVSQAWSVLLGNGVYLGRSLHALHRLITIDGEEVITPEAIVRAKHLVSLNVERTTECASTFPISPVHDLLRAFPVFAVDQIYAEAKDGRREHPHPDGDIASGGS